jgi:hypothetical protein
VRVIHLRLCTLPALGGVHWQAEIYTASSRCWSSLMHMGPNTLLCTLLGDVNDCRSKSMEEAGSGHECSCHNTLALDDLQILPTSQVSPGVVSGTWSCHRQCVKSTYTDLSLHKSTYPHARVGALTCGSACRRATSPQRLPSLPKPPRSSYPPCPRTRAHS